MFGGGAGSILDMINSIKNNSALLKKRRYFKKQKENLSSVHFNDNTPSLSQNSIDYNLEKNIKFHRYDRAISVVSSIFALVVLGAIIFGVFLLLRH